MTLIAHDAVTTAEPLPAPDPSRTAFFFDVDGTLLEIRPRPEDVVADAALRKSLTRLGGLAGGALALVSGRALADLDRIFAPLTFAAAGLHGAEMRLPDGTLRSTDPTIMDHARPALVSFVALNEGLRLEDKGATLAIHFRDRPDLAGRVLDFLSAFMPNDELAVQEGKMVAELKPAACDKGTAIASLMRAAPFAGRRPVFYGDDLTDESAFEAVNRLGGVSVRIGEPHVPTRAQHHLPTPAAMREHLQRLIAEGGERAGAQA